LNASSQQLTIKNIVQQEIYNSMGKTIGDDGADASCKVEVERTENSFPHFIIIFFS
jgi:hypothetical protein